MNFESTQLLLEKNYSFFHTYDFVADDPICIPHRFTLKQDIEISGFFAAIFSWGLRKTIINKSTELLSLMDNAPYQFITQHQDIDLKKLIGFKHRTFNDTDLLYFVAWLRHHFMAHSSLEQAFCLDTTSMFTRLVAFNTYFFSLPYAPQRTAKHISSPTTNAACKRLVMYLRWMVRSDDKGIDFGIWNTIPTSHLVIPLDVHVLAVAQQLGISMNNKQTWKAAEAITNQLKLFDANDPTRFDFALFGLGVLQKNRFNK